MPRDTRLTLWPEQLAYYPLFNPWAEIKNATVLDFSECLGALSCGLTATVLNFHLLFKVLKALDEPAQRSLKFSGQSMFKNIIYEIIENDNNSIMDTCRSLGFFNCIKSHLSEDLLVTYCTGNEIKKTYNDFFNLKSISYPIFHFDFSSCKISRREILDSFYDYIIPIFDNDFFGRSNNKGNQLIHVLEEIVKNIADHTMCDGFLGIDIIDNGKARKMQILIGDLGPGIYKHIKEKQINTKPSRRGKGSLAEAYKLAITNEVTSKSTKDNKGLGMSSIINNCIALNVRNSVFDLQSMLLLSSLSPIDLKPPSHNELWRCSFRIDGKKPFFYFLECEDNF